MFARKEIYNRNRFMVSTTGASFLHLSSPLQDVELAPGLLDLQVGQDDVFGQLLLLHLGVVPQNLQALLLVP